MYKVLIIGCGKIAYGTSSSNLNSHGEAFEENTHTIIAACVDIDKVAGNKFAKRYNCKFYDSVSSALKIHAPDIVSVCTPDSKHFSILKKISKALCKPKIIFIEKPICTNRSDLEEIESLYKNSKTLLLVNHSRRFSKSFESLKKHIQERKFGQIKFISCYYYTGWLHNGVHIIDTLQYLFDEKIIIHNIENKVSSPLIDDPTLNIRGSFIESRCDINIFGFDEHDYQVMEWDLFFSDGRLKIQDFGNLIEIHKPKKNNNNETELKEIKRNTALKTDIPIKNAVAEMVNFLTSQNFETPHLFKFNEVKNTMDVMFQTIERFKND